MPSKDFCLQQSLYHDQKDTSGTSEARSSLLFMRQTVSESAHWKKRSDLTKSNDT